MRKEASDIINAIVNANSSSLNVIMAKSGQLRPLIFNRVSLVDKGEIYNEGYCWHPKIDDSVLFENVESGQTFTYEKIISLNTGDPFPGAYLSLYVKEKNEHSAVYRIKIDYDLSVFIDECDNEELYESIKVLQHLKGDRPGAGVSRIKGNISEEELTAVHTVKYLPYNDTITEIGNNIKPNQPMQTEFIRVDKISQNEITRDQNKLIANISSSTVFKCVADGKHYNHDQILNLFKAKKPAALLVYVIQHPSDKVLARFSEKDTVEYDGQGIEKIVIQLLKNDEVKDLSKTDLMYPMVFKTNIKGPGNESGWQNCN